MTVASPATDPDREVLERVAAGDRDAFTELVERHQERVLRLAERFLGDADEARDAAQDVFFKVYRKAGSFSPQAKVSTWIHRITVNHCLNRLRRRKIVRFLPFAQGDDPEDLVAEPADGAVRVSAAQLGYLLDGIDWRNPRHTWRPAAAG